MSLIALTICLACNEGLCSTFRPIAAVMNQPSDLQLPAKLARAFADAVVAFVESGVPQGIDYDPASQDFVVGPVDDGSSPTDVGLWVGARWRELTGPIAVPADPAQPAYATEALRKSVLQVAAASSALQKLGAAIAIERVSEEMRGLDAQESSDTPARLH